MLNKNDSFSLRRWTLGAPGNSENFQYVTVGRVDQMFLNWIASINNETFLRLNQYKIIEAFNKTDSVRHSLLNSNYLVAPTLIKLPVKRWKKLTKLTSLLNDWKSQNELNTNCFYSRVLN